MVLVTFTQVIARYVFNTGFVWALEMTRSFFGLADLCRHVLRGTRGRAHWGRRAVNLLSPARRMVSSLAAVFLCIVYVGICRWGATGHVRKIMDVGIVMDDFPIQKWMVLAILPVGLRWWVFVSRRFCPTHHWRDRPACTWVTKRRRDEAAHKAPETAQDGGRP